MAKLKGPLLSMDARGQIGKSLVFMGWKGLKTVRSHVVPANPNTGAQSTQRGVMTTVVAAWHAITRNDMDLAGLNLAASLMVKTMSGFNYFCKAAIDAIVAGLTPLYPSAFAEVTNTGGTYAFTFDGNTGVAGHFLWGYKPTVLGTSVALTGGGVADFAGTIAGLTAGDYIYIKPVSDDADTVFVAPIYKVLVAA